MFSLFLTQISSETDTIDSMCENWTNKHVFLAKDVHYYNMSFAFIKIDTLDNLNITVQYPPREYDITVLKIYANNNILLNTHLDLSGVFNIINRSQIQNVVFQNVIGFNENNRKSEIIQLFRKLSSIQIINVNYDFYRHESLLKSENCTNENFNSKTNFFGNLQSVFLIEKVFYNNKICPYVFKNAKLEQLFMGDISNSLIFTNRVEFLGINETNDYDMNTKNLKSLILMINFETLSLTNLNPFVFKNLKYLLIEGNLEHFDDNLFENFKGIRFISIKSEEIENLLHRGTKWLNSINKNLNVNLGKINKLKQKFSKLVSVEFNVQGFMLFSKYYIFPNEDICLFKDFPHSQLVLPLIIFDPVRYGTSEFSCTLVWLLQHYKHFFTNNFTVFNQYINIEFGYKDLFRNETLMQFQQNESFLNEKFLACHFSQRFEKCLFKTQ